NPTFALAAAAPAPSRDPHHDTPGLKDAPTGACPVDDATLKVPIPAQSPTQRTPAATPRPKPDAPIQARHGSVDQQMETLQPPAAPAPATPLPHPVTLTHGGKVHVPIPGSPPTFADY